MTDQQFCLRWNNHQSTLVAVFDGLLEKGVLVDCTLAAEGQQLTAHKVVLAACSPFLETLLSRHYDKHPILILKDVKFSELKAMMDYMYRGEVNISQDQLGTFLKAAESLQIKGLSDGGGGNEKSVDSHSNKRHHDRKQHRPNSPLRNSLLGEAKRAPYNLQNSVRNSLKSSPLLVDIPEDSPMNKPHDGSMSPVLRKKKRPRDQDENSNNTPKTENIPPHEAVNNHQENSSNSLDLPNSVPVPRVPSPSESKQPPSEPNADKTELKQEMEEEEDINEDSVELTLEDEDMGEAGPSHNDGEFGEFYGGTQDGDHRDGQVRSMPHYLPYLSAKENAMLEYERLLMLKLDDSMNDSPKIHACPMCGRCYKIRSTLNRHIRYECGMARKKLACEICGKKFSRPDNLKQHEQTHVTIYFSGETAPAGSEPANAASAGDTTTKEGKGTGATDGSEKTVGSTQQIFLIEDQKASMPSLQIQGQPVKIQLQNQPTARNYYSEGEDVSRRRVKFCSDGCRCRSHGTFPPKDFRSEDLSVIFRGSYKSRWTSNLQYLLTDNLLYQNQPESLNLISESASVPPKLARIKQDSKLKQRKSKDHTANTSVNSRVLVVQQDKFSCQNCERVYKNKDSLGRHLKWECGKEPSFPCSRCPYKARYKADLLRHEKTRHLKREANPFAAGDVY